MIDPLKINIKNITCNMENQHEIQNKNITKFDEFIEELDKCLKQKSIDHTGKKYDEENKEELIVQDIDEQKLYIKKYEELNDDDDILNAITPSAMYAKNRIFTDRDKQKSDEDDNIFKGQNYIPLLNGNYLLYINKYDNHFPILSYDDDTNEYIIKNKIYPNTRKWDEIYNKLTEKDKEKINYQN